MYITWFPKKGNKTLRRIAILQAHLRGFFRQVNLVTLWHTCNLLTHDVASPDFVSGQWLGM